MASLYRSFSGQGGAPLLVKIMKLTNDKWADVPMWHRYSNLTIPPKKLVKEMRKIDRLLDLKFYLPTERWHVVRTLNPITQAFTRVWELSDRPDLGLRQDLGYWIIDALKAGDLRGYAANRARDVDTQNRKLEENKRKKAKSDYQEFAKDIRKPMQKLYDYGEETEYKGVF